MIAEAIAPEREARQDEVQQVAAAGGREPAEVEREDEDQQQAEPEARHRHAEQRDAPSTPTSSQELRRARPASPSGTPTRDGDQPCWPTASWAVLPRFSPISVGDRPPAADRACRGRPRSALPTNRAVLLRDGLVEVELRRASARPGRGVVTNSASIIFTGSPGTRNSMLKTASVTPNSTGTTARTATDERTISTPRCRPARDYFAESSRRVQIG